MLSRDSDDVGICVGVLAEIGSCCDQFADAIAASNELLEILVRAAGAGIECRGLCFSALARALKCGGESTCIAFTSCGGVDTMMGAIGAWTPGQPPWLAIGACMLLAAYVSGEPDSRGALMASGRVLDVVDKILVAAAPGSDVAAAALVALQRLIADSAAHATAFMSRGVETVLMAHVCADGTEAQCAALVVIASLCTLCKCAPTFASVVDTVKRILLAEPLSMAGMEACMAVMPCLWNLSPSTATWIATSDALDRVAQVSELGAACGFRQLI